MVNRSQINEVITRDVSPISRSDLTPHLFFISEILKIQTLQNVFFVPYCVSDFNNFYILVIRKGFQRSVTAASSKL